jgi:excisionase family DNA binding protein
MELDLLSRAAGVASSWAAFPHLTSQISLRYTHYCNLLLAICQKEEVVNTISEEFLSPQEVGERLGASVYTVRRWIKAGDLPAFKPGKEYRVRQSDLEEFLRAREVRPKVPDRSPFEPSFNDVLDERRRSRFAEAVALAAERWAEAVASTDMNDSKRFGIIDAALDLSDLISGTVGGEEDWEALTSQEQREIVGTMEKLGEVADLGLRSVHESTGTQDQEQRVKERREQMRERTRLISA